MSRSFLFIIILVCLGAAVLPFTHADAGSDVSAYASLDRLTFAVDRSAMLMVTVEGASRGVDIELPETPGIEIDSRGQSSKISIVNGDMSSSIVYNYVVRADEPGSYTIGPITVKAGGEELTTSPLQFTVTSSELMDQAGTSARDDIAFIQLSLPESCYLGELIPVTIKAYFTDKYQASINSLPELTGDGIVMDQLSDKPEKSRERVAGKTYNVLSWNTTLAGVKSGERSLRVGLDAVVLIPQQRRSGRSNLFNDPFFRNSPLNDPFFGSMFGDVEQRELKISSNPITMQVLPLPQDGQPAGFNGAVGTFKLKVTVQPTAAEVGEPLNLTIGLSGEGNFDSITPPQLTPDGDWKTYNPIEQPQKSDQSFHGSRVWEQAIVAKNSRITEIPPLSFSFFNPKTKEYETLQSAPVPVTVNAANQAATQQQSSSLPALPAATVAGNPSPKKTATVAQEPVQQPAAGAHPDLAPIKLETGAFTRAIKPLFLQTWYLAAALSLMLLLAAAMIYTFWRHRKGNDPERERRNAITAQRERGLTALAKAADDGDSQAFLLQAKTLIQEQMGAAQQLSPSAITVTNLHHHLAVDSKIPKLFEMADAAQYGGFGIPLSKEDMGHYLTTIKEELSTLC